MLLKESIPTNLHNYDTLLSFILKAIIELENSFINLVNATQSSILRLLVNVQTIYNHKYNDDLDKTVNNKNHNTKMKH